MIPPAHTQHSTAMPSPARRVVDITAAQQSEWTSRASSRPQPQPKRKRKRGSRDIPAYNKKDPNRIPRPPNSFILFRKDFVADRPQGSTAPGDKSLSKQAGDAWRILPGSERKKYAKKAHEASAEHARKNPGWKYQPAHKSSKSREEKAQKEHTIVFNARSPPVPFQDGCPPPSMIRKKESLRLYNWDDSVISPSPHTAYPNRGQDYYQLPESLNRRSSSVPIPESWNSNLAASSSFGSNTNFASPYPMSNMQHRLSYSGIRPGFVPLDIYAQQPQHEFFENTPLQPLPAQHDDPPPSFEGYRIVCESATNNSALAVSQRPEALYVSPFTQVSPTINGETIYEHTISRSIQPLYNTSPSTPPCKSPPPLQAFNNCQELPPAPLESAHSPSYTRDAEPAVPANDFVASHAPDSNEMGAPGESFADMRSSDDFFPFEMSVLDYLPHQFAPNGLQMSGLEGFNVSPHWQDKKTERASSLGLWLNCSYSMESDMFSEFVEIPRSGPSTCGSSPLSRQPLDLESTVN